MNFGLGTAQFGMNYGISNTGGPLRHNEIKKILCAAERMDISIIDTAAIYGSSEEVLGEAKEQSDNFQIVTKTTPVKKNHIGSSDIETVKNAFTNSLKRLRREQLYGLLVHNSSDLLVEGGEQLFDTMIELKNNGFVKKIGASVYSGDEIDQLLKRYDLDIVQLPINVFDQRLLRSGHLKNLKSRSVEIHARSIFLQGLLLLPLDKIPGYFRPLIPILEKYHAFLRNNNLSYVEGAFAFAGNIEELDIVITGVCRVEELYENMKAYLREYPTLNFDSFAIDDVEIVNPGNWKVS